MQHFKLALKWFFFVRELNPSSCKCYFLIWLMHVFLSWNFVFCNITEKPLFIPPPAKASVIQPSHMQTTSSRCWSLAKIILCFSTPQHSRELCQQGTMPACAPQFSHSPVPGEAVPGTSFLTCCPFIHLPMTSPSTLPAAWLPRADVVSRAQSHTKRCMLFITTSLIPWLNGAMFEIRWVCGTGLRRDLYEVKVPLNRSSKCDLGALFQWLDSSCRWSAPQPFRASTPKALHCTSSHQPAKPWAFQASASIVLRSGQVSGWGNRQLSCIC